MKRVALTGATGFLGFALLTELIQNEIFVYALCRKNSNRLSRLDGLPNIKIIEVDLNCLDSFEELNDCDVFYHLAWEGERNDFDAQYRNIDISVNCIKMASRLGCKRFVCTGSQAEYGNTTELITEEIPLKPTTAYGVCKVAAYYLTADLAKRLNMEHTWARVFSVYGPNDNPNTLIMTLIRDIISKGEATLDTDGEHIWNYLYEEDAARALRLLGALPQSNTIYNVAGRESKPLKEFVEIFRNVVREKSIVRYGLKKSLINLNVSTEKLSNAIGEFELIEYTKRIMTLMTKDDSCLRKLTRRQ